MSLASLDLPRRHLTGEWVDATVAHNPGEVRLTIWIRDERQKEQRVVLTLSPSAYLDLQWVMDCEAAKSMTHRPRVETKGKR